MTPAATDAETAFAALLARFPPAIVALQAHCLARLRDAVPCTHQLVYDYGKHLVVALGASERGNEAIVAMAIHPDRIQLYFDKSIPDPERLLQGAGGQVRSVALADAAGFDRPGVQALVAAAIAHSGAVSTAPRSIRLVIKAKAKKAAKP
jgi:hypothetical protein